MPPLAMPPLEHSRPGEGLLGLRNPTATHAGDTQGRIAERILRFEFADPPGMSHSVLVTIQPGAPGRQSRMGQGILGMVGNDSLEQRHGIRQLAGILEFFSRFVPLFASRHPNLLVASCFPSARLPRFTTRIGQATTGLGLSPT